jgi:hypothetical protein
MKRIKKIFQWVLISVITLTVFAIVLEVSYRYQWFDFYKAELKGLNRKEDLQSTKKKILICGDSFSADTLSYVSVLRNNLSEYSVINSAVPGTGIRQHALYMPGRIKKYDPDIFIYQFYVGNDLFDISHPSGSSGISNGRKLYWWLADKWLSLPYLNFRFAGLRYKFYDDAGGSYKPKEQEEFSIETYSKREKFNYKAEPGLVDNTLFLEEGRDKDWEMFERKFRKMVKGLKPSSKKMFVVVPHQSQLSIEYFQRHVKLGAQFGHPVDSILGKDYPLYKKIGELCKETGFMMIDPLEVFRLQEGAVPLYYANDPHLSDRGNQLLGYYILMWKRYGE